MQHNYKAKTTKFARGSGMITLVFLIFFNLSSLEGSSPNGKTEVAITKVTGQIIDIVGEPLIGVSVLVKGTSSGTVTDLDGMYEVTVNNPTDVLVVSYVGYDTQEIVVGSRTTVNITLKQNQQMLDEVVVVGYGSVRKRDLTGSVATINTNDLKGVPTARVDQMLQGRTAGVQITSANGSPGAGTVIRVRGGNSIVGDNEPLWVIDGIIVGQSFDLNNINTNDIKSIEILKDASSVAIYGSRGANGVVLVTTKSGKSVTGGKPEITMGFNYGTQNVLRHPEMMSGPEHVAYANEDARFRKLAEPFPNPSILPDNNLATLLTGRAPMINADMAINGSTEDGSTNYYISGNYFSQDGIVKGSDLNKYIFRSNLDIQLTKKLKTGVRMNISRVKRGNSLTSYQGLLTALPERAIYNQDGLFNGIDPITTSVAANPVADVELNTNETLTNNILGTVFLDYRPIKNLTLRSTFNPEINNVKTNTFESSKLPNFVAVGDKGRATINGISAFGWNNENTAQYDVEINKANRLSLLGGASFQKYTAESTNIQAFGISSDATTFNNLGVGTDPTRHVLSSGFDAFQIVSFFGRANYSLKDKYLFTLVGRTDGSSRFAAGNKYAFFPSAAFAWRLAEEDFIKNLNVFSDLKFRASFGKAGSQAIDSYRTLGLIEPASTTYNGVITNGTTLGRPDNEKLKWETTKQLDLALEASFFKGRLFTEFNYYDKTTSDLLLNVRIPRQSGFISRLENIGRVRNKGMELLVTSVIYDTKNFNWSTTATLSGNRNKVEDLGGVNTIDLVGATGLTGPSGRLIVGETAPVYVGVNYLGTFKSAEELAASKQVGRTLGGPKFDDPNGDGQISPNELYVLGSPQPDHIYGIQNNFRYKAFDLAIFFQGTQGNEVFNGMTLNNYFTRGEMQKYKEVVNRWTPTNNTSDIPGVGYLGGVPGNSAMVEDGSHFRLKTLRIGYAVNTKSSAFKALNFYLSGSNLLLFSNMRLVDPEVSQFAKEDPNGNVLQGYVNGQYPSARVINMGLNATF